MAGPSCRSSESGQLRLFYNTVEKEIIFNVGSTPLLITPRLSPEMLPMAVYSFLDMLDLYVGR